MHDLKTLTVVLLLLLMVTTLSAVATGAPTLYPVQTCGFGGDIVTVTGSGFPADSLLTVTWSGMPLGTQPDRVQSDAFGRVAFSFVVPYGNAGDYTVFVGTTTVGDTFTFSLGRTCPAPPTPTPSTPTATPSPTPTVTPPTPVSGTPRLTCPQTIVAGQTLSFTGDLFHPGAEIASVHWDGVAQAFDAEPVHNDGQVVGSLLAPSDTFTVHTLTVTDAAGGSAACFPNLTPADPTATASATPTVTPSPSPTVTPGPPPGITVTPDATPAPGQVCAAIGAVYTRTPVSGQLIRAGLAVVNTGTDWTAAQLALWQYQNLRQADTGIRVTLPAAAAGERLTLTVDFPAPATPGQVWYQWRLLNSTCTSAWQPLTVEAAVPGPPGRVMPVDGARLNNRRVMLNWLPALTAPGAPDVTAYEVQVLSMSDGVLFDENVVDTTAVFAADRDYPPGSLAWRVRARSDAGWGLWTPSFYFGIDTRSPAAVMDVSGVPGTYDWWRSPLTVRVGGTDSDAAFFQPGDAPWQQVIPGGTNILDREGRFTLRGYTRDTAFNRSPVISRRAMLDWTPPTGVEPVYSSPLPASGFFTAPLTVTLRANDNISGVLTRALRTAGGTWQTDRLYLFADGNYPVDYFAADTAGNASPGGQAVIRLDRTPPDGQLTATGDLCQICPPVTVSVTVSDTVSGVAHWTLRAADRLPASGVSAAAVPLSGEDYPVGDVALTLAVTDHAGWVSTHTLSLRNLAAPVVATPTPWAHPTATLMPAAATPTVAAYSTVTPSVTATSAPHSSTAPPATATPPPPVVIGNYPLATGTAIPVILPVTGAQGTIQNEKSNNFAFPITILHFVFLIFH